MPGSRYDDHRIALSIEGGVLRGVISAAMLCAIDQLGLLYSFDAIYGSSGGAINGAFLQSDQALWGIRIYYEDLISSRFVNPFRIFNALGVRSTKPIVDLDYTIWQLLRVKRSLNTASVLHCPVPLRILATSLSQKQSVVLDGFASGDELFQALEASSAIPGFTGEAVKFREDKYLDAFLYERIPFQSIIQDDFSHVLTLMITPNYIPINETIFETQLIRLLCSTLGSDVQEMYATSFSRYKQALKSIQEFEADNSQPPFVTSIFPRDMCYVPHRLIGNRNSLLRSAKHAYGLTLQAFGYPDTTVVEVLRGYNLNGIPTGKEV